MSAACTGPWLPLLQQESLVVCDACKRVVLLEAFEAHHATCSQLPLKALLADEEAAIGNPAAARPRSRSPHREKNAGGASSADAGNGRAAKAAGYADAGRLVDRRRPCSERQR